MVVVTEAWLRTSTTLVEPDGGLTLSALPALQPIYYYSSIIPHDFLDWINSKTC